MAARGGLHRGRDQRYRAARGGPRRQARLPHAGGGGLGPLPTEAQLLDEFVPEERLLNRCEAVIRVFNRYGNRENKNKARLKFVLRERGIDWLREQIEKEYEAILAGGGIAWPERVPEGFGGYQSQPQPLGAGRAAAGGRPTATGDGEYDRLARDNVKSRRQTGYAAVTVRVDQGNLHRGAVARPGRSRRPPAMARCASVTIDQNVLLAFIPLARLPEVHAALGAAGLGAARARRIDDVVTCPGATPATWAHQDDEPGRRAAARRCGGTTTRACGELTIKVSGCPNACGHHWIADFGFYGNARKIDGREVPYYQMLLGGGYDEEGIMRFGLAVQSIPARLAPAAVSACWIISRPTGRDGESFRQYVLRHKVETFRELTRDLAKPAELFPEIYQDWGDDEGVLAETGPRRVRGVGTVAPFRQPPLPRLDREARLRFARPIGAK
jgi:sulfite reductase beta subunit-like hemoprotein